MESIKVVVLLGKNYPKDMKLIQFMLRANRVQYQLFEDHGQCTDYLEQYAQVPNGRPPLHLLLTDTSDRKFLFELSGKFPFCHVGLMIGEDLQGLFEDEEFFNSINCFFARNDPNCMYFPNQVMGAIHRILNKSMFGLRHFMHGAYSSYAHVINSTNESHQIASEISSYVHNICQNNSMTTKVEGICDELIMNALYAANPRYETQNRDIHFNLDEEEKVVVSYACDGRLFSISVSDQFGRLGKETIYKNLRRCFFSEQRISFDGAGAGLGLYRILNDVNSLVINVIPGVKTEVIGLLDISLSRRASEKIAKSFYYLKG